MSTSCVTYLMHGYRVEDYPEDHHDLSWDEYDALHDRNVFDGMCGEYVVFGKVISSFDEYDGDDVVVVPDLTVEERNDIYLQVVEDMKVLGWEDKAPRSPHEIKTIVFRHFH